MKNSPHHRASHRAIRYLAFVAGLLMLAASTVRAAHTAYVFNTDGNALPAELIAQINARGGVGTQIIEIRPDQAATINGVPVRSVGVVTLPRFDGVGSPPVAYHFLIAGNLNLAADQSIWGWGSRLLMLEVANNASFAAGSFVTVGAIGRLGGAGGGNGGVAAADPFPTIIQGGSSVFGSAPFGGFGGDSSRANGEDGAPGVTGGAYVGVTSIPHAVYAASLGGGSGGRGEGEDSSSPGGPALPFTGSLPSGGSAGIGGTAGADGPIGAHGGNGSAGGPGGGGEPGRSAAPGQIQSLAGTVLHLRAGSGGGSGGTGGRGIGGASGGGAGGGGRSGAGFFDTPRAGGRGGSGRYGGVGGAPGVGGAGGGGGGGIQLFVRGTFHNAAAFQVSGANGGAGAAGGAGAMSLPAEAGQPGGGDAISHGGTGGSGGLGGAGGLGGNGGNGASGAGGNIQIVAAHYAPAGATFDTAGGVGGPAGLAQIQDFMGAAQNAPFGFFSARPNGFRSYRAPNLVTDLRLQNAAVTPLLPGLQRGAAPYGLTSQDFSPVVASSLSPAADTVGMVLRLSPAGLFGDFTRTYTGYDLLIFTSVKSGRSIEAPAWSAINPTDAIEANDGVIRDYTVIVPNGPQPLIFNAGYLDDPAIFPGASGPTTGSPIPYGPGYAMLVEKDRVFDVTARFSPYGTPRTFSGRPIVGTLSGFGALPAGFVQLKDRGLLVTTLTAQTPFETGQLIATAAETSQALAGSMFVRVGSTNAAFQYAAVQAGNFGTVASGTYDVVRYFSDGSAAVISPSYSGVAAGATAFSGTIPIAASGWQLYTTQQVGAVVLHPDYDEIPDAITCNVVAKFVGPRTRFAPPVVESNGRFDLNMGTLSPGAPPINRSFGLVNFDNSVPAAWQAFLSANPQLQRLTVHHMQIIGPGASAFSLLSSPSMQLDAGPLGPSVSVRFSPPGPGNYAATLRIFTDQNADLGQAGDAFDIELQATALADNFATWALALPPGLRGPGDDADGDGVSNIFEFATRREQDSLAALPVFSSTALPAGGQSNGFDFNIPVNERISVRWTVEGSDNLADWEPLAERTAPGIWAVGNADVSVFETLIGENLHVSFDYAVGTRSRYFYRLQLDEPPFLEYENDFSIEAGATLRGSAVLNNGSLRLTDSISGQTGTAVLDGVDIAPNQTGFDAAFTLITGPTTTGTPADGVSFAVGDLGGSAWGENGPATARNLSVAFDTFENGTGPAAARGIRIMANGAIVASNATNPYTNGTAVPVEVSFDYTTGVTVRFNGATIFANVQVPGFVLQPGDRFGFGARTGGFAEVNRVDNVSITPH